MATNIILMDNVDHLGNVGDSVTVKDGYARNFLFPQGLAVLADKAVVRQLTARKAAVEAAHAADVAAAQTRAAVIAETSVTIPMQAGEDDKLFGSVTSQNIIDALAADGIEVGKKEVQLPETLKELGVFDVTVQIHKEVSTTLKVWVVKA